MVTNAGTILRLNPDDEDDDEDQRVIDGTTPAALPPIAAALRTQQQAAQRVITRAESTGEAVTGAALGAAIEEGSPQLRDAVASTYRLGGEAGRRMAGRKLGQILVGFDWTLADRMAQRWAAQFASAAIAGLDQTTRDALNATVAQWIADGTPLSDLRDRIAMLPTFSPDRALVIAQTEMTRAYAQGSLDSYEAAGWQNRPAPEEVPPAHPRCRCAVSLRQNGSRWEYVWMTANDEKVCATCGGKTYEPLGDAGPGPAYVPRLS